MLENSAYGVTVQGSAGDRLEPDYNMENNPLYEMRSLSNDTHSHKTQTTAPVASPCVYMILLIALKKSWWKKMCNLYFLARMKFHKVLF